MYRPEDLLNNTSDDDDDNISSSPEYDNDDIRSKIASTRTRKLALEEQMLNNRSRLNPRPKPIHHQPVSSVHNNTTHVIRPRSGSGSVQIISTPKRAYESGSISDYEKYVTTSTQKVQDTTTTKKMNHSKAYINPIEKITTIHDETDIIMNDRANLEKLSPHVTYNSEFINDTVVTNSLKSQRDLLRRQQIIMSDPYFQFYSLVIGFIPNSVSISSVKKEFNQIFSSDSLLNSNSHLSTALTNTNLQSDMMSKFTDDRPFQPTSLGIISSISGPTMKQTNLGNEYNSMYQRSIADDIASSSLINGIVRVNMPIISNLSKAFGVLKTACPWMRSVNDPTPLMFSKDAQTSFAELVAAYITQCELITPVRFVGKTEKHNIDLKIVTIINVFKNKFHVDNNGTIKYNPSVVGDNSLSSTSSYSIYPKCPFYVQ